MSQKVIAHASLNLRVMFAAVLSVAYLITSLSVLNDYLN